MSEERFSSCLGKFFRLGRRTKEHILKHPEMRGELEMIGEVLEIPDEVRTSIHDASVLLFYRFYSETKVTSKYLLVALFNASKREGKSVETVLPIKAGFSQA